MEKYIVLCEIKRQKYFPHFNIMARKADQQRIRTCGEKQHPLAVLLLVSLLKIAGKNVALVPQVVSAYSCQPWFFIINY